MIYNSSKFKSQYSAKNIVNTFNIFQKCSDLYNTVIDKVGISTILHTGLLKFSLLE